jgi:hypothetical protein
LPEFIEKSRRLFFHSAEFAVRHLALQFITDRKGSFQMGVAQERLRRYAQKLG